MVCCNGNIHIRDDAYAGTSAIFKQGKPGRPIIVGERAVVGCGAVVTKDIPTGVTVVGNPARPMVKIHTSPASVTSETAAPTHH